MLKSGLILTFCITKTEKAVTKSKTAQNCIEFALELKRGPHTTAPLKVFFHAPENISPAKIIYRFDITCKALAGNCFRAVVRNVGYLAESLAFIDFGDMDFDSRDRNCLKRI